MDSSSTSNADAILELDSRGIAVDPPRALQDPKLGLVDELQFWLATDPGLIQPLIVSISTHLTRITSCDERARIAIAVALEEALTNALFHGNLEISSELREREGEFQELVRVRRGQTPYCHRQIDVRARFARSRAEFVIRDEGPGFDVSKLPDPRAPENLSKVGGRGVLMMRWLMDDVAFNELGTEVTMLKRFEAVSR